MWSYVRVEFVLLQFVVTGASCFVNLALEQGYRGIADMGADPQKPSWNASKAIDGNVAQDYNSNSCAITNTDQNRNTSIWWKVWLQRQFNVAYIEIYFRSDTYTRSAGFSVYTYIPKTFYPLRDPKHLVYHQDPKSGCPASVMNITVNNVTQGIAFINTRPQGYTSTCPNDNTMYTGIEICEVKVMGCDARRFSPRCLSLCPYKCKNRHCDVFNGSCIHGCTDQNALTLDCIVCPNGKFISNKSCVDCPGHCKEEAPCNKLTGMCDNGCANHWNGTFCNICSNHYYSIGCNTPCGHCKNNDVCDKGTGSCPNGCQNHWQGERCNVCSDHYYGTDCSTPCGRCKNNGVCDIGTGRCHDGCSIYWEGEGCDICQDGFYNATCSAKCGHCIREEICEKHDGTCINGCRQNFKPPLCQECVSYKYGPNCGFDCGHCKDGKSCAAENGVCSEGCDSGWIGDLCVTAKLNAPEFDKKGNKLTTTGVAIIASVSTMFAISLFVIFYMSRHIMKNKTNRQRTDASVPENEKASKTYADLSAMDENHAYSTLGCTVSDTPYNVIRDSHHNI
ncbi:laminin subunit beta-1-like [Crassostrea angulata]|uniref:laminin subunit beta-1-like n=1 Tax=Magallana angulata TaxID=2784310 RepID=UPI0022B1B458|nr:laminin subunit beta-1-like [Crassostrea angulata]